MLVASSAGLRRNSQRGLFFGRELVFPDKDGLLR